jgi:hypothetical protein
MSATPPFVVTETLSRQYYKFLPSKPRLVATTNPNAIQTLTRTGPEAYSIPKQLTVLGDHPLAEVWDSGSADKLRKWLNEMHVNWTSLDLLRLDIEDISDFAIIWIGVEPGALSFEEGSKVAHKWQALVQSRGIGDFHVEIRESVVRRQTGNKFLDPVPAYDPTFAVRDLYTATLSIPISTKNRPWAEGTGGFYLSAGGDDKSIYLVTARHVVLPLSEDNDNSERKNDSQPPEEIIILGNRGFHRSIASFDDRIETQQIFIHDTRSMIKYMERQSDQASTKARKVAIRKLENAQEEVISLVELRDEIGAHWSRKESRIFGELVWAPPIVFSTEPGEFTQDLAAIKVDPSKLNASNYHGNTVHLGDKYTPFEFLKNIGMDDSPSAPFQFPDNHLVSLKGQVSMADLRKSTLNAQDKPCFFVFKNGGRTGMTIGKVNNVSSYTRTLFQDQYHESREWPVVPLKTDKDWFARPFSKKGDSGSCVFDVLSRFCGMITGGSGDEQVEIDSPDVTYITPMPFVMDVLRATELFRNTDLNPTLA